MDKFIPTIVRDLHGGKQWVYSFENNKYGASVVSHSGSYGGDRGLFEVAVLKDGDICYETPITQDVVGYLDFQEVGEILQRISELP